ncbi:MAG: hypothetical protein R3D28_14465 [Geminicoccaceae bacterium]
MGSYRHLTAENGTDRALQAEGQSVRAIVRALGSLTGDDQPQNGVTRRRAVLIDQRSPKNVSAQARQRPAVLERDPALADYVTDRLAEGWTPEQIAGRLKRGVERGLRYVSTETIHA